MLETTSDHIFDRVHDQLFLQVISGISIEKRSVPENSFEVIRAVNSDFIQSVGHILYKPLQVFQNVWILEYLYLLFDKANSSGDRPAEPAD